MTDTAALREAAETFNRIINQVENRCMAVDGPVTPTLKEITESELRELWLAVQAIPTMLDRLRASPAPDRVSVKPLPEAFVTSQSGDGEYAVHIKCRTMSDMHQWHDAVLDAYRNTLSEDKS